MNPWEGDGSGQGVAGMWTAIAAFLDHLEKEAGASRHTVAAYRNDLTQFLEHISAQGVGSWKHVTQRHVLDFRRWLQGAGYTISTVARKVAAVRSFFHYLIAQNILDDDPSAMVPPPRVPRRMPRVLSSEEVNRLLDTVRGGKTLKALRDWALLELLYATGLRVSEVISLRVEDVDLEEAVVHYRGEEQKERTLPLTAEAAAALRLYLERGRPGLVRHGDVDTLFVNYRGRPLTRQGLWLIVREQVERAGIEGEVTPHTLRHSCAVRLLKNGAELQEVKAHLGHANLATTQVYLQDEES